MGIYVAGARWEKTLASPPAGGQGSGVCRGAKWRTTTAACPNVRVFSGRVTQEIPGDLVSAGWMASRYISWGSLSCPRLGLLQLPLPACLLQGWDLKAGGC